MPRLRRSLLVVPAVIAICAGLGGFFGSRVRVSAAEPDNELSLGKDVENFTQALNLVERNFADAPNSDKEVYKGAIPGMLRTLDPHSNFFDPKDYQLLREEQRSRYYGVGMTVQPRNGKTVVVAPFPGSPAYKAGMRPGDVILTVDGKSTDGLSTTEVADLLKGARGTQVTVAVSREGVSDPISFSVTRDEIKRDSVQDAFWVKPGVAYVKILSFAETTSAELNANLRRLGEDNLKGLILDLRGNPGGLLNEGVAVAGRFLPKGSLIVSHHGRSSPEKPYYAKDGNQGRNYPIVVLVDSRSASAAEIVSGALQDHDRAWILGETTFGKGLVQTVYPLAASTGLALTTAHFYTPSGRLIQRDYTNQSFYDYYFRKHSNARNPLDVKMTDSGRTVYGGGGITPDEKYEAPKLTRFEGELTRNGLFEFTRSYFASHSATLPANWLPDDATFNELHEFLLKNKYQFTEAEFLQSQEWIKRQLAREFYTYAFNVDESDKISAKLDPEVAMAVEALPKAEALLQTAQRVVARRMSSQPSGASSEAADRRR
jgi:carboxyl-terminal processing protease